MSRRIDDLSWLTARYFSDFPEPHIVNSGWCFVWAWMARVHLGERVGLCTVVHENGYNAHAFVELDGLFRDAERPRGVRRYRSLPWFDGGFGRGHRVGLGVSPDAFLLAWDGGNSRINFMLQGLPSWPTRAPKRPPRPMTIEQCEQAGVPL